MEVLEILKIGNDNCIVLVNGLNIVITDGVLSGTGGASAYNQPNMHDTFMSHILKNCCMCK